VYLFGLRDFGSDQQRSAPPAITISSSANAALNAAVRPESIPPINRGVQVSPRERRLVRPPARPRPPAVADAPTDSARLGATTGVADSGVGRPHQATASSLADPQPPADTGGMRSRPPIEPGREPVGYVPMATTPDDHPGEPVRSAPSRTAKPTPAPGSTPAPEATPAAAHPPPLDRRKLEGELRDAIEECYRAVRSKDLDRLAKLYAPKTPADEDKLRRLTRILRTEPWEAVVGRRVDGVRELASPTAAAEFSFRLTWRDSYGGRLSSQPIFRVELARDGEDWTTSGCRIVGSPKL